MNAGRTLEQLEAAHSSGRIKELERNLAAERRKVEALAAKRTARNVIKVGGESYVFGLFGDTHFGSLYTNDRARDAFFRRMADEGVETAFHTGDALDGGNVYRGQEFELRDVGLARQAKRLAKAERCGVKVKFVAGNHDLSFKNSSGVDVGKVIEAETDGAWSCLGEEQAVVDIVVGKRSLSLMLLHPGGGSSYALSYRMQKIIESLEGGTKPDILASGHYHKMELLPSYRNVLGLQTGTFQDQTPFMVRKGLAAHVGGWIIRVEPGDGCLSVKPEFVIYF